MHFVVQGHCTLLLCLHMSLHRLQTTLRLCHNDVEKSQIVNENKE